METLREELDAAREESERIFRGEEPLVPPGAKVTRPGRAGTVVQSVRLPADALAEIERIAAEQNVPVGALIRSYVLGALAGERVDTMAGAVEQLAADVDRLRRLMGRAA